MNNLIYKLHDVIFGSRSPKDIIGYGHDCVYHLYDLQISAKTLSVYLSMQHGNKVAIACEDEFLFLVGFIAALYAKKSPVLSGAADLRAFHLDNSEYDILLTDSLTDNLNEEALNSKTVVDLKELLKVNPLKPLNMIPKVNKDAALTKPLSDSQTIIFYTSGSTGKSKSIIKTLNNMQVESEALDFLYSQCLNDNKDLIENLIVCATVPCTHTYGLTFRVFFPLLHKIPFYSSMLHYTEELCSVKNPMVLISSPAFLSRISENIKAPDVKACVSAGSKLEDNTAARFNSWTGKTVTEIYGSTETNVIGFRFNDGSSPLFTLAEGVKITKSSDGEFTLYSTFIDKKFKLSDNLELTENGVKLLGRTDRIVKIDEKRVSLVQIENELLKHSEVKDAYALTVSKGSRTSIGAVIAADTSLINKFSEDKEAKLEFIKELKFRLSQVLIPNAMPKYFRFVEAIPVNEMGKKVKNVMEQLFL